MSFELPAVDMAGTVTTLVMYLVIFFIVLGVGWFLYAWRAGKWMFKKYGIPVLVHQVVGNLVTWKLDEARFFIENNKPKYEFKQGKFKAPASAYKDIQYGNRLEVYSANPGEYVPVQWSTQKAIYKNEETGKDEEVDTLKFFPVISSSMKVALADQFIEDKNRFNWQSTLDKYLPYIMFGASALFIIVLFWQNGNVLSGATSQLTAATDRLALVSERIINSTCSGYAPPIPK